VKITIFGSTGATGRLILDEGVRRGHAITAFARQASALDGTAGIAAVVEGDARDPGSVAEAIAGSDAVIVTVAGHGQPDVATAIARTVTSSMLNADVRRLVTASSYAMVAVRPYVLAPLVRRIIGKVLVDQRGADAIIAASELDWTIARATRLVNSSKPAAARQSTELFMKGPWSLSRAAYAALLLDLAQTDAHVRETINTTG
jgi:putative NADH-flavin reductase